MFFFVETETERNRTKAGRELVEGEKSIAVRIEGIKYVLQLLRTERELSVQPLFKKTQNTAATDENINPTVAITTATWALRAQTLVQ